MNQPEDSIEKIIVKETRASFSQKIEDIVWDKDISYMEALELHATSSGIEPEKVKRLISKDLLAKLEREAEKLNLLTTKKSRLDL